MLYQILKSKSKNENGDAIDIEDLEECLEALGFSADDEDVDFLKKHLDENSMDFIYDTICTTKIDEFVCPPNISETVAVRIMKLAHRPTPLVSAFPSLGHQAPG